MEPMGRANQKLADSLQSIAYNTDTSQWHGKILSRLPRFLKQVVDTLIAVWNARSFNYQPIREQRLLNEVQKDLKIIDDIRSEIKQHPVLDSKSLGRLVDKTLTRVKTLNTALEKISSDPQQAANIQESKAKLESFEAELAILKANFSKNFHENLGQWGFNIENPDQKTSEEFHDEMLAALKQAKSGPNEKLVKGKSIQDHIQEQNPPIGEELKRINGSKTPIKKLHKLADMIVESCKLFTNRDVGAEDVSSYLVAMMQSTPEESTNLILTCLCLDSDKTQSTLLSLSDKYAKEKTRLTKKRNALPKNPTEVNEIIKAAKLEAKINRADDAESLHGFTASIYIQILGIASGLYNEAR